MLFNSALSILDNKNDKIGFPSAPSATRPILSVESIFKCYNMNPQKFEQLLHNFFGKSCLNIDVFDQEGKRYTPREWFIAPLDVIEQAVHLIISWEIVKYQYDSTREVSGGP